MRLVRDSVIKDRGLTAPWTLKDRGNGSRPAAICFDALRRFLLVRFPDSADKIAQQIGAGLAIEKVELILPFKDEELWPDGSTGGGIGPEGGYEYRANWGVDELYRKARPTWHAVAFALRKPWQADGAAGPTYNASVNGKAYWKKYGAADTTGDRFARQFGPAPVHYEATQGRMDITALFSDETFGKTLEQRLRNFADCGMILRKWETYDHRYYNGCYEWATATGGRAIVIDPPKLIVTFRKADNAPKLGQIPPAADIANLPKSGGPTAIMPDATQLDELARKFAIRRPDWMSDWQWQRVRELLTVQQGAEALDEPFWLQFVPKYLVDRRANSDRRPRGQIAYEVWVDTLLAECCADGTASRLRSCSSPRCSTATRCLGRPTTHSRNTGPTG